MTASSAPESVPLLDLKGVRKSFLGRTVLEHVDLRVMPGQIITLIGPNGGGKSTLVRIALGLMKPDHGTVHQAPDLTIGYMPQKLVIDPLMPLPAERFLRLRPGVRKEEARDALATVGIEKIAETPVQALSGGEFQRLLLARALLRNPRLLVLDEPVQGVDLSGQVALYRLIGNLRNRLGCGVLMISHDLHLVMSATDEVVCLNGHVCCSGTPHTVKQDPAYLRLFGSEADALALYTHDHTHDHHHDHDHKAHAHDA
ncbi:zinc ABC transporter ATP-binding protein ZnuC [Govanella unica]|uniref:Zinc ABC transporter ATP-binding protein ZnuC n=1 Tax=Govanella unica TaxID=2975056 RepID=A0A9X3Z7L9_9PROT|nr:zinc ABC transporter ATP-binding protein ZnuC [Govania unica]MDA5194296.1 zinc ABC transporter ATP-binding protein ZnuC [Govania unica]